MSARPLFDVGDLVETTAGYEQWAEEFSKQAGYQIKRYMKGTIRQITTLHSTDPASPNIYYVFLENHFSAKAEHFQKVI